LRSRVAALVEQEGVLLTQAFELSRAGGDRSGVDALFAQVQAIQVERSCVKKQLGDVLGTHRMHVSSEVWREGLYDYRAKIGGEPVRVKVTAGPLGMQVRMPGGAQPVAIELLEGSFDGPMAADHDGAAVPPMGLPAHDVEALLDAAGARKPPGRARSARKKPT
jgi:hypothetical protein